MKKLVKLTSFGVILASGMVAIDGAYRVRAASNNAPNNIDNFFIVEMKNFETKTKNLTIVGSNHSNKDCAEKVVEIIRLVRPETVVVELCDTV